MSRTSLVAFLVGVAAFALSRPACAEQVPVANVAQLTQAIAQAIPGDEIVLASGTYDISTNLNCTVAGSPTAPIVVRSATPRGALLRFNGGGSVAEGFKVSAPHWRFEDLDIQGSCLLDANCEHAFHLFGNADFTIIRGNRVRDFNAQIKSNISAPGSGEFPDDVLVERNEFSDTRPRDTSNPVTKIDVVGGRRWVVRANEIRDFQKAQGDTISYAAFLKGNSRDGVFERNLVRCARDFTGGVRLGLSFGGGGTSPDTICEDGTCSPEHQNGIMRNNLVLDCNDVGIYLNEAANSHLQHNTLYATAGIDVRYPASTADIRNNLLGGTIDDREGGTSTRSGNVSGVSNATFAMYFVSPASADFTLLDGAAIVDLGVAAPLVTDDYCGNDRDDGAKDIGALEYDEDYACFTTGAGGLPYSLFSDGFEG